MICPSCQRNFLVLFHCEQDDQHRCNECKGKLPPKMKQLPKSYQPVPAKDRDFKSTPGPAQGKVYRSPYVSSKSNHLREERARLGLCRRCSTPTRVIPMERGSRNAVYCDLCMADAAKKARERESRRRALHLCVRCGNQAHQYQDGHFSVQCLVCNSVKAARARRAAK